MVGGARRAFTVAERGAFDWHCTYTTVPDEISRTPYHSGELLLAVRHGLTTNTGPQPAEYRATWKGQWYELHTRGSGPPPDLHALARVFDAFRITDTPLGMLVAPRSTRQATMEPVRVAKQLPGIGHLTIEHATNARSVVPEFRGHPTEHGELWRQPLAGGATGRARQDALLLATPTALTRLMPGPQDNADPAELLAVLASLNVIWEAA